MLAASIFTTKMAVRTVRTQDMKNKLCAQKSFSLIDPIWKSWKMGRRELYGVISRAIGCKYHTANIRTLSEARGIYRAVRKCIQAAEV